MNEANIWHELTKGDRQAFADLYRRYYAELFLYVRKLTGDETQSEDIIHEVFCYLWEKRSQIQIESSTKFYLLRAVRNRAIKDIRESRQYRDFNEAELGIAAIFHPEELKLKDQNQLLKQKLAKALNNLSVRQREIIYLKYYNNLSYEEIAELLAMNYQSVINSVYRGMSKLRNMGLKWFDE